MWGAVIGDLSGSIYEYSQTTGITTIDNKNILISPNSFYSDDTILTIAILDAYLNDKDYSKYLKLYTRLYKDYQPNFHPYFKTSFSPGFLKWANDKKEGISTGNGALMRISPVAYLADSLETLVKETRKATLPSHNSEEALTTTDLLARIIFLARHNTPKEDILKELNIQLKYVPFTKFNTTCNTTIGNCLYAAFTSNSYEEAISKVISYGGDTDTNACIVGSIAESLYGLDPSLIEQAKEKIPDSFTKKLELGYRRIK